MTINAFDGCQQYERPTVDVTFWSLPWPEANSTSAQHWGFFPPKLLCVYIKLNSSLTSAINDWHNSLQSHNSFRTTLSLWWYDQFGNRNHITLATYLITFRDLSSRRQILSYFRFKIFLSILNIKVSLFVIWCTTGPVKTAVLCLLFVKFWWGKLMENIIIRSL